MESLARRNLFRNRGRLTITLAGLSAALLLILFGTGMFTGTVDESVAIVDRMDGDIWVLQEGNHTILSPSVIQSDVTAEVARNHGIASIHRLIYSPNDVEKDGHPLSVMVVGFDISHGVGGPHEMVKGDIDGLLEENTVILDQSIEKRLGRIAVGESIAVGGLSQKVVGISRGGKWFNSPYVFTSHENAQKLGKLPGRQTSFLVVGLLRGHDVVRTAREISKTAEIAAYPAAEIREHTREYIITQSAMGLGIGAMMAVGVVVGAVIIVLTMYTAAVERLPEHETLRAIGISQHDLYTIILAQVLLTVSVSYVLGAICAVIVARAVVEFTLIPVSFTPASLLMAYLLTLALSTISSLLPARRVKKIEPVLLSRRQEVSHGR